MGERKAPVPGVDLLFTDEDATEILEYLEDEVLLCPGCGHPRVETMAIENSYAFTATAMQCHLCAAKTRGYKKLDDTDGVYMVGEKRV